MTCIENETSSSGVTEEGLGPGLHVKNVKRLVSQAGLMELPSSEKLLVRRLSRAPGNRPGRNPGLYERLLGDESVRTHAPLLLRPWVKDCAHKEAVHLGEKVTLVLLQRVSLVDGYHMAESGKRWIRWCYTCQARKNTRKTVRCPLIPLPLSFDVFGSLPVPGQGERVLVCLPGSRFI